MKQFEYLSSEGLIKIQPLLSGVTFLFRTMRFTDVDSLCEYIYPVGIGMLDARSARKTIVKNALNEKLITAYQKALTVAMHKPETIDLINELCSRGVKVSDISIQCQADKCSEECATSNSVLIELGEAAVEAADIEGFCDKRLICMAHKLEEDEIHHQEKLAEELESRKEECCECS